MKTSLMILGLIVAVAMLCRLANRDLNSRRAAPDEAVALI